MGVPPYPVSDTYRIRIRHGYTGDTYPIRIGVLGCIGPGNLRLDTYLSGGIRPSPLHSLICPVPDAPSPRRTPHLCLVTPARLNPARRPPTTRIQAPATRIQAPANSPTAAAPQAADRRAHCLRAAAALRAGCPCARRCSRQPRPRLPCAPAAAAPAPATRARCLRAAAALRAGCACARRRSLPPRSCLPHAADCSRGGRGWRGRWWKKDRTDI